MTQSTWTDTSYNILTSFLHEKYAIKSLMMVGLGAPNPSIHTQHFALSLY